MHIYGISLRDVKSNDHADTLCGEAAKLHLIDLYSQTTRVSITSLLNFGLSDNKKLRKSFYQQLVFGLGRVLDRHLLDLADDCRSQSMKCEFQELALETMTVKRYCEI